MRPTAVLIASLHVALPRSAAAADDPPHLAAARDLVGRVDRTTTSYAHGRPDVRFSAPVVCHADCSGFVDALLRHTYGYTPAQLKAWFGADRPTADRFHDAIAGGRGFEAVADVRRVEPGDFLAVKYKRPGEKSTGHLMLAAGKPRPLPAHNPAKAGLTQWAVQVIDSARSGHGPTDTRRGPGGQEFGGLGEGVLRVYADPDGRAAGYTWSVGGTAFLGRDEADLAVGRLKRGFTP